MKSDSCLFCEMPRALSVLDAGKVMPLCVEHAKKHKPEIAEVLGECRHCSDDAFTRVLLRSGEFPLCRSHYLRLIDYERKDIVRAELTERENLALCSRCGCFVRADQSVCTGASHGVRFVVAPVASKESSMEVTKGMVVHEALQEPALLPEPLPVPPVTRQEKPRVQTPPPMEAREADPGELPEELRRAAGYRMRVHVPVKRVAAVAMVAGVLMFLGMRGSAFADSREPSRKVPAQLAAARAAIPAPEVKAPTRAVVLSAPRKK